MESNHPAVGLPRPAGFEDRPDCGTSRSGKPRARLVGNGAGKSCGDLRTPSGGVLAFYVGIREGHSLVLVAGEQVAEGTPLRAD